MFGSKKKSTSHAIVPINELEDEEFDDLNELAFAEAEGEREGEGHRRSSSSSKKKRDKDKSQKKKLSKSKILRDSRISDESFVSASQRPSRGNRLFFFSFFAFDWRKCLRVAVEHAEVFLLNRQSRRLGAPFLLLGLLFSAVLEVMQAFFRYNIVIMLVLSASTLFPHFPTGSVRPQLCVSVLTLFSFVLDIYKLSTKMSSNQTIIVLVTFVMVCKALVFNAFLRNTNSAPRTRKYLDRRLRLFYFPLRQPKRIMRDVRGRFLALGWIHLFSAFAYAIFLIVFLLYFDYSILLLSEQSGKMLPMYLLIKCVTTLLIFFGILYDTDVTLALWYFGCLGFNVPYVRKYIVRKRIELKGWPLAFSYYGLRFYLLSFVKVIDVSWGVFGWYLIGTNYIDGFLQVENSLKIFLTFLIYTMVISDIWCPILFFSIRWLLKRQKMMKELKLLELSDDSENEEFKLQDDIEPTIRAAESNKQKLENYHKKYIEEGFEGEMGREMKAPNITRKPSRVNNVTIKGKSKRKENTVMPEAPPPANVEDSYGYYDYDFDPEGQIIIDPVVSLMHKEPEAFEPSDVLDSPNDVTSHQGIIKLEEERNPLITKSTSGFTHTRTSNFDDDTDDDDDNRALTFNKEASKRISPIEFAELWDLFARKEYAKEAFVCVNMTKYFLQCCELSDPRKFIAMSQADQNSVMLKGLTLHFSNIGVQVVTAGIYNRTELSVMCARIVQNKLILLIEVKIIPVAIFQLSHNDKSSHIPVSAEYVIKSYSRANSIDQSRLGYRVLQLDKMFASTK